MKKLSLFLLLEILLLSLTGCGSVTDQPETQTEAQTETPAVTEEKTNMKINIPQTGDTVAVPAEYTRAANEQGSVTRVDYDSEDYVRGGGAIKKTAYVYTPYGYDENDTETRYDILYLKQGGYHDFNAVQEYLYNALPLFFPFESAVSAKAAVTYTTDSAIDDVINDPVFYGYGRLIFPVNTSYYGGSTLGDLSLTRYNYIDPDKTVEIVNYMSEHAAAVIVNYTGLSEVTGKEPPTYSAVGTADGIASYRTMQSRINAIKANGTDAMIEIFSGLPHGFGLGTGTLAEGWINNAVAFWERNMK